MGEMNPQMKITHKFPYIKGKFALADGVNA